MLKLVATTGLTTLVLLLTSVAVASPLDHFEPTEYFNVSDNRAGAHPDVTAGLTIDQPTGCRNPDDPEHDLEEICLYDPQTTPPYRGEIHEDQMSGFYMGQDPKAFRVLAPEGLAASLNAVPVYCDAQTFWVPFKFADGTYEGPYPACQNSDAAVGSQIGTVDITASACIPFFRIGDLRQAFCPHTKGAPRGASLSELGSLNWERPKTREQGAPFDEAAAMVGFWGYDSEAEAYPVAARISFRAVPDTLRIEALAQELPDYLEKRVRPIECGEKVPESDPHCSLRRRPSGLNPPVIPSQAWEILATVEGTPQGSNGALITNSTACDAREVPFEFVGWGMNTFEEVLPEDPRRNEGGHRVETSTTYQPTDCEVVPYSPTLNFVTDTQPNREGEISIEINQPDGQATTEGVEIAIPLPINASTKAATCSEERVEKRACRDEARIGTAQAIGLGGVTASGPVYATGVSNSSVQIAIPLQARVGEQLVELTLKGKGTLNDRGEVIVKVGELPRFPVRRIAIRMPGGPSAVFKTPRNCGDREARAKFTAHNGKVFESSSKIVTAGCKDRTSFDAELSTRRPRSRTQLTLKVDSPDTELGKVDFHLPAQGLYLATEKRRKQKRGAPRSDSKAKGSDGLMRFGSESREISSPFQLIGRGSTLRLQALSPLSGPGVADIGGSLSLTRVTVKKSRKARGRKRPKRTKPARAGKKDGGRRIRSTESGLLTLKDFPAGTTDFELKLGSKRRRTYLLIGKKCNATLRFVADVKKATGKTVQLEDSIRLNRCKKKRY